MDKILAILTNYMSTRTDTCKHVNEIKEAKYVKKQKEKSGMCPKCKIRYFSKLDKTKRT